MKKTLVLIPTLNPNADLIEYVDELINARFTSILIIDDGSSLEYQHIFTELDKRKETIIHRHIINLGKGRALKNGFNFFLNMPNLTEFSGIITVDSDGQHSVADVINIRDLLNTKKSTLILGSRNFNKSDVPFKSAFGNKLTSKVFQLFYGEKLSDTQTGLRALSTDIVVNFIALNGERFEYETNMLIEATYKDVAITELEIETIYIDDNSETHFRPVIDSLAIYGVLFRTFFKYMGSSIISFLLDIVLFQILIMALAMGGNEKIIFATIGARIVSSLVNYLSNKNIVFQNSSSHSKTLIKYFGLVVVQMICSALLVTGLYSMFHLNETVLKVIVDSFLFFISFRIQKVIIFK